MKKNYAVLIILFIALSGCATIEKRTEGTRIDKYMVESIKPGATTRKAMLEIFGSPSMVNKKDDGSEEFIYKYVEKKVKVYVQGFIVDEKNAPTTYTTLEIIVKDDIITGYRFVKSSE
ncbi:MAG: outer membrane protein assembly factor BamE [Deltaproteobacteria bacterium]|nr:outer membrane protein assembly factor BamE [Deltaproteobacteria bacterium]